MSDSLYHGFLQRRALVPVGMNDLGMLSRAQPQQAIGTQYLNGCTCVIILGLSVILAHIAPFDIDDSKFRVHHDGFLEQIHALVRANPEEFPPESTTGIGLLAIDNTGWIAAVKHQIEERLCSMGFDTVMSFYAQDSVDTIVSPKGELVIYRDDHDQWRAAVERTFIWPRDESTVWQQTQIWDQHGLELKWTLKAVMEMLDLDLRAATEFFRHGTLPQCTHQKSLSLDKP
jgi:hypothetical protein